MDNRNELQKVIDGLYSEFSRYAPDTLHQSCADCVEQHEIAFLQRTPLRELSAAQLENFAWKSMTTLGTVTDYRHFLPRICEITAIEECWPTNIEVALGGKLHCGAFEAWPSSERAAVQCFFDALWKRTLTSWPTQLFADELLCCIGRAPADLESALAAWLTLATDDPHARKHLAAFVCSSLGTEGWNQPPPFWEEFSDAWNRVISWLRNPATEKAVEIAFEEWLHCDDGAGYEYRRDEYRGLLKAAQN